MKGHALSVFLTTAFLGILLNSSLAHAATVDSASIDCDYQAASTIVSYYEPKVQSSQKKGKISLIKDGNLFKGEVAFGVFKMKVEGEFIGSDLSLSMIIIDDKYTTSQKIVAMTTSLHRANEQGIFVGTVILRSPQVATLAMQADVIYETAPLEKLSTGNNFLGAYLSCQ